MSKRAFAALVALWAASPAEAADAYMWGVGPRIGTTVLPGRYPVGFPPAVADDGAVSKIRDDLIVGLDAAYYANRNTRLAVAGGADLGAGFYDLSLLGKYNWVADSDALDFLFGVGAGFGTMRWNGEDDAQFGVNYFPIRGEAAAMIRDKSRAYQGTIFAQADIPSSQTYLDRTGTEVDVGTGLYLRVGLELTLMFGDFTPPKPKKKKGKKGGGD